MIIHPDNKADVIDHITTAFAGRSTTMNYRIITKDGLVKNVLDYAKPDKKEANGQILAVVASTIDISSKKEFTI